MPALLQVDLWMARAARWRGSAMLASLSDILSDEERARVARMALPEGQYQQLMTRALTRKVLSRYLPAIAPAEWRFERNAHGRPSIAADMPDVARRLHFSLAHTEGLVLMAVAEVPMLGVDVERADQRAPLAVARRYFSVAEIEQLETLAAAEQPRRFRRLWTLKEAYLKALGTGVAGGLDSMTFHFDGDSVRFEREGDPNAASWVFREFEVEGEFLLALAVLDRERRDVAVDLRDYLPEPSGEEQSPKAEQRREADAVREGGEDHARR
jgi:4'-phosphopantetheinyl transferase